MSRYVFDLDGTLCTDTYGDYESAEPHQDRINIVNNLYKQGHYIVIFTARGMGSSNNNRRRAIRKWKKHTSLQLHNWGVMHHELHLGKPAGDVYVDDKAMLDVGFFKQFQI
jgi:beta-phosphoglucomutase-like phosphatase (HAD superfamily)